MSDTPIPMTRIIKALKKLKIVLININKETSIYLNRNKAIQVSLILLPTQMDQTLWCKSLDQPDHDEI